MDGGLDGAAEEGLNEFAREAVDGLVDEALPGAHKLLGQRLQLRHLQSACSCIEAHYSFIGI